MGRPVNPSIPEAGYKSKQQFEDTGSIAASDFAVVADLDNSRKIVFDTSLITTPNTTVTLQVPASGTVSFSSGGEANVNLSNLASVAINTSLLPASGGFPDLGAFSNGNANLAFGNAYIKQTVYCTGIEIDSDYPANTANFGIYNNSNINAEATADVVIQNYGSTFSNPTGILIGTASLSGNTQDLVLVSGKAIGSSHNSGNVVVAPGAATGTRGKFKVQDGTEGTSGHALKSSDTTGGASWGVLGLIGGGTGVGAGTKATAFDALQPMTTGGDLIYGGISGTGTRLANGNAGQFLVSAGGTSAPAWGLNSSTSGTRNLWFNNTGSSGLTSATDAIAIGSGAGVAITSGIRNIAIGTNALNIVTTANSITALGYSAGGNTNAILGTFIGANSGVACSSGSQNTYVGAASGAQSTSTSASNTGIGCGALNAITSGSGQNTALGNIAGNALTTGSNCVLIGASADVTAGSDTNAIAIGQGVTAASNTSVIGNASTTQFIPKGALVLSSTTQTITAGQSITSSASYLAIQSAGALSTSTSTVIVAGLANAQSLIIVNVGANSITLKSGGNTDLPGLTDYVLTASSSISFIWDSTAALWFCTCASVN